MVTSAQVPPSQYNNAFTSREAFESALESLRNSSDPRLSLIPELWRRIFHPKGTAFAQHARVNIQAIMNARQAAAASQSSSPPPALTSSNPSTISSQPTPTQTPQDDDVCGVSYKFFFDHFEIHGENFDQQKLGVNGTGLRAQIQECGDITKWKFNETPNDPHGYQWYAYGNLPSGTKACVGRAVVSAGGATADGCHGPG